MAQIADLYWWPILWEKYRPGYMPYQEFRAGGRLIECVLDAADLKAFGTKFSCFELVEAVAAPVGSTGEAPAVLVAASKAMTAAPDVAAKRW